jgi:hypothetical protein
MSQPRDDRQDDLFRPSLEKIINLGHPLVRLAAETVGIVLFCADARAIGCSDYCLRNFRLAIRSRAAT